MRNNALVMSPWRQSIWVSHEIGIIIPPAPSLVSNQLQGPGPRRGKRCGINCWCTRLVEGATPNSLAGPRGSAPEGRQGLGGLANAQEPPCSAIPHSLSGQGQSGRTFQGGGNGGTQIHEFIPWVTKLLLSTQPGQAPHQVPGVYQGALHC